MSIKRKSDPYTPTEIKEILTRLQQYEQVLDNVENDIAMKGKQLGDAQREQASLGYFYDVRKVEVGTILKSIESKIASIRGRLHRMMKEQNALDSSERQIEKYIDAHDEFITANELKLYAEELYKKFCDVEIAFTRRGFVIRDFTNARIAQVHKDII